MPRSYCIHNILTILCEDDDKISSTIDHYLYFFRNLHPALDTNIPRNYDIVFRSFQLNVLYDKLRREVMYGEDYYYINEGLFSKKTMTYIKRQGQTLVCYYYPNPRVSKVFFESLMWLKLIEKGFTFVHATAVEYYGRTLLLPGWGGSGKTILSILFLNEGGRMLGDDLVILSNTGVVYAYPTPFAIYPYHITLLKDYFLRHKLKGMSLKIFDRLKPFSSFSYMRKLLRIFHIRPYISIHFNEVFPKEKLCLQSRVSDVYLLVPTLSKYRIKIKKCPISKIVNHAIGVFSNYFLKSPFFEDLSAMTAFGFLNYIDLLNNYKLILNKALSEVNIYEIHFPVSYNLSVFKKLVKLLS